MIENETSIGSASREKRAVSGQPSAMSISADSLPRVVLYKVFSMAFLFPTQEIIEFLSDRELPEYLEALDAQLSRSGGRSYSGVLTELAGYLRSAEFLAERERLASAYHALFHIDDGVWLYESEYTCHHEFQKAENLADISGFYRAFGLQPNGERHDHLSVQLEFMHALAFKEAYARAQENASKTSDDEERLAVTLDAERKFLGEHLARWIPAFARAVRERRPLGGRSERRGFYLQMVDWLQEFVNKELNTLGVDSIVPVETPVRLDSSVTDFECPFASDCQIEEKI